MRVRLRLQSRRLRRVLLRPDLRPTQEETLLRRKPVNIRRTRPALKRLLERVVSHVKSTEVGDGFAGDEFALKVQARLRLKGSELVDDALGALVKVFFVALGPPVLQVPHRIEFAALVVVAVRDLVTDNSADGAIVDRIVSVGVKEGRLQYSGGE